ncbi:carboxypeptidase regulatory-like domain-containing protein [Zunongwangia sp. F363]|uniref:Carboxypeptidase regulatory-like domain-containing protein n=1 Tax=Autumnicola tepida TaxID=3075595 RepID=A0ABU3CF35_9FLAO|nr:carboxypeptidase regulatory-like domain-containing protein [Zunongwangia sp. F363]MDT0644605.1 carboxypeptidase regulatory-like domain-containing protein [Zunongwangia sp. F363]
MNIIFKYFALIVLLALCACSEDTVGESITGNISGKVVEESSNEPIENVKITTSPASSTVFTDENGDFFLSEVIVDQYSVKAEIEDYATAFEAVTVTEGATSNVAFEMVMSGANNRQPSTPEPISPEDNATGLDITVDFVWQASDPENDELTYQLELRNSADDEVRTFENISDTTYTVEGLNYGYKYFWQVKVSDSINDPVLSPLYSFETSELPESRYLFVRQINGNNVIFSSNDEGDELQLTSSSVNSFRPRRNNATNKIAFLRTVGGRTQLFTMMLDGTNEFQVTSEIPVNGYDLEKLGFSWANDGNSLLYPNFGNLYSVNATGGGTQKIYTTANGKFITDVTASEDGNTIALLTNNANGYDGAIYTIDAEGSRIRTVISGMDGALGGIDLSVDKRTLLFTRDVSEFENDDNRQLDSRMFLYTFATGEIRDISENKPGGTNDLDPRFSPNEAEVVFVNTSNDDISQRDIYIQSISNNNDENDRTQLVQDAIMPDWE